MLQDIRFPAHFGSALGMPREEYGGDDENHQKSETTEAKRRYVDQILHVRPTRIFLSLYFSVELIVLNVM